MNQERADQLAEILCNETNRCKVVYTTFQGKDYTGEDLAYEITIQSDLGNSIVAVAGLVLRAMEATPELFAKKDGQ